MLVDSSSAHTKSRNGSIGHRRVPYDPEGLDGRIGFEGPPQIRISGTTTCTKGCRLICFQEAPGRLSASSNLLLMVVKAMNKVIPILGDLVRRPHKANSETVGYISSFDVYSGNPRRPIVQVKSGHVRRDMIASLKGDHGL